MAFMWRGFSCISEVFRSNRHLRYLLVLSILVAMMVVSFMAGHLSSGKGLTENDDGQDAEIGRERRDISFQLDERSQNTKIHGGIAYTRWGRTECPDGVDEVYSGVAGGSDHGETGGGSNYLCLPLDPIWGTYNATVEKYSKLWGAEYEVPMQVSLKNVGGQPLHDHNVPCVVCHTQTRNSVIMIPARNRCYRDWNEEYRGYLMAENSVHNGRTQFVCMDGEPEADPAGFRDENGALFYNVAGVCGSLPCPPYVARREITCVVCTK